VESAVREAEEIALKEIRLEQVSDLKLPKRNFPCRNVRRNPEKLNYRISGSPR
jgi:hypothetical protein